MKIFATLERCVEVNHITKISEASVNFAHIQYTHTTAATDGNGYEEKTTSKSFATEGGPSLWNS